MHLNEWRERRANLLLGGVNFPWTREYCTGCCIKTRPKTSPIMSFRLYYSVPDFTDLIFVFLCCVSVCLLWLTLQKQHMHTLVMQGNIYVRICNTAHTTGKKNTVNWHFEEVFYIWNDHSDIFIATGASSSKLNKTHIDHDRSQSTKITCCKNCYRQFMLTQCIEEKKNWVH